jgi:hypothetical protein
MGEVVLFDETVGVAPGNAAAAVTVFHHTPSPCHSFVFASSHSTAAPFARAAR